MSLPFAFQQFTVEQNLSAFKVGTDSVLLGSWAEFQFAEEILDIGTGTGILALMAAQKSLANIDAVEIDPLSANNARKNFLKSPWQNRLHLIEKSIQEFMKEPIKKYDYIITNPPYFENNLQPENFRKKTARHNDNLGSDVLINCIKKLLKENGSFYIILPSTEFKNLKYKFEIEKIYLHKYCEISSFMDSPVIRIMGKFSFDYIENISKESLFLYENSNRVRSNAYKELTKEFYF